jgi:hypothetical protein
MALVDPLYGFAVCWTYLAAWGLASALSRRPRVIGFRAAAVTLSLAAGLVLLEAPAAFGLVDYDRIRQSMTAGWNEPDRNFVLDPELSFRRPPDAHWSGRPRSDMARYFNLSIRSAYTQTFTTDRRGFRNRTALDRADIALVGDSYVEGAYVSDEETAAVRLQQLTGRAVANLGVSGYGPLQELVVLKKYALPLQPHFIGWFFFEGNDLDDDEKFEDEMAYLRGVPAPPRAAPSWSKRWRDLRARSFTQNAFTALRELTDPLVPDSADSFGWFRDARGDDHRLYFFDFYATRQFGDYERSRLATSVKALREGSDLARARGARLVVFFVPIKFRVYGDVCTFPAHSPCLQWHPWDLEARLADACRQQGIEFVSLTDPMRRAAAGGQVLYAPEDSHWNAAGQLFVAHEVARVAMSAP